MSVDFLNGLFNPVPYKILSWFANEGDINNMTFFCREVGVSYQQMLRVKALLYGAGLVNVCKSGSIISLKLTSSGKAFIRNFRKLVGGVLD